MKSKNCVSDDLISSKKELKKLKNKEDTNFVELAVEKKRKRIEIDNELNIKETKGSDIEDKIVINSLTTNVGEEFNDPKKSKKKRKKKESIEEINELVVINKDTDDKCNITNIDSEIVPPSEKKQKRFKKKKSSPSISDNENLMNDGDSQSVSNVLKDSEGEKVQFDSSDSALQYVRDFCKSKDTWKFQKHRQMKILRIMYDSNKVSEDDFEFILQYICDMKGQARVKTQQQAGEIIDKHTNEKTEVEESSTEDKCEVSTDVQYERARKVIQLLV